MKRQRAKAETAQHQRLLIIGRRILFALALLAAFTARIRLLGIPLERDEGEYAYAGQLLLEGIPPYQLAYNMKFPGTYAAYALIMSLFGQSPTGVHLGLLIVNLATIALLYLIGRRLFGEVGGLAAASAYTILSVSLSVLGCASHATHFVNLPFLGAILLLLRPPQRRSLAVVCASGALMGLAILMKQPGLYLALFGGLYLLWTDFRTSLSWNLILWRGLTFALGISISLGIPLLLLWRAGVFGKFWFWTIEYAYAYGGINSFDIGGQYLARNFPRVVDDGWLLWLLAGIGVTTCFWNARAKRSSVLLLGLLGFSILAVSAGLYFREHYFILALPAVSLFVAAAITALTDLIPARLRIARLAPLLLFSLALALPLFGRRDLLYLLSPAAVIHQIAWDNPFPESLPIAKYLEDHTSPDDTIAVFGSEPQIYFYSHRHSATGYIYTYGLMENHPYARQMQTEIIEEIEKARPKFVVFVSIDSSWLVQKGSDRTILDWINTYLEANYSGVGLVNVFSDQPAEYYLPLASKPARVSPSRILIYERNS
jgi:hypothetical protein